MTNQFYFKINLNKFGEQRLQQEREGKTFRNAAIFFLLGFIIILVAWFYILGATKTKVENRRKYLAETQDELNRYKPVAITVLQ
jgi:hypothetical protein